MGWVIAFEFPVFSGFFKPEISEGKDVFIFALKFIFWGDVSDGAVKTDVVVMVNPPDNGTLSIIQGERGFGTDAIGFDGTMPAFDFAIALRIFHQTFCFARGQDVSGADGFSRGQLAVAGLGHGQGSGKTVSSKASGSGWDARSSCHWNR